MIVTREGVQVGGYLPPAALRETLDKLAAENARTASAAPAKPGT